MFIIRGHWSAMLVFMAENVGHSVPQLQLDIPDKCMTETNL